MDLVALVLTSSVVGALASLFYGDFRDWRRDKRLDARMGAHLALQLAVIFEAFGGRCGAAASNVVVYRNTKSQTGSRYETIPDLDPLPEEVVAWRSLWILHCEIAQ